MLTAAYWPNRPEIAQAARRPPNTCSVVLWDIVVANVQVALIILFKPRTDIRSKWITVPLDLASPEAITVLAGTITMTPGTVSAMLSADGESHSGALPCTPTIPTRCETRSRAATNGA